MRKEVKPKETSLCGDFAKESFKLHHNMVALSVPHVRPSVGSFQRFRSLSYVEQKKVIEKLKFYNLVCQHGIENAYSGVSDQRLTWFAISELGLRPSPGLFNHISIDDCVEVYDREGVQSYCSLNFYKFCSYSSNEILMRPWSELYYRSAHITEQMFGVVSKLFSGEADFIDGCVDEHRCLEIQSEKKRLIQCNFGVAAPLYSSNGSIRAFLVTSRMKILNENQNLPRPELENLI